MKQLVVSLGKFVGRKIFVFLVLFACCLVCGSVFGSFMVGTGKPGDFQRAMTQMVDQLNALSAAEHRKKTSLPLSDLPRAGEVHTPSSTARKATF